MRLMVLAVALVGLLALPGSAAAQASGSDCGYTTTGEISGVGVQAGSDGMTGGADPAVGACLNTDDGSGFEGGSVEAGVCEDGGAYAVIDGDNENTDPADGYMGLSGCETGGTDSDCEDGPDTGSTEPDEGSGSNSGRCFGIDGGPWEDLSALPVRPICGNSSGASWNDTYRDGCSNP